MAASYEFATGSVRVREGTLLSPADLEQLMAAPDEAAMAAILRDKGFDDPAAPAHTVEEMLRCRMEETWSYLFSLLPDPSLLDALVLRNDLHNAKCLLKGVLGGREVERLLLTPSLTRPAAVRDAIRTRSFGELPDWLAVSLERAYDILAQSGDAQRADAALDCAAMQAMREAADRTGVALLRRLVEVTVFYADVTLALRAARVGMPEGYLDLALCPCEGVEPERWKQALRGGESKLLETVAGCGVFDCAEAAEAYRRAPAFFEKWVDDYRLSLARTGRDVTAGAEVPLGYLLAREAEDKAVRMIVTGRRTGQDETALRERMRELYGNG